MRNNMKNGTSTTNSRVFESLIFTVMIHALLPVGFYFFCIHIVPEFSQKAWEFEYRPDSLVLFIFKIANLIQWHSSTYGMIIAGALILDGMIYYSLMRFWSGIIARVWSWLIIFLQTLFLVLCIYALLILLEQLMVSPAQPTIFV